MKLNKGQICAPNQPSVDAQARGSAAARSIGNLLATGTEGIDSFSSELFKTNLRRCIGSLTDGNMNRFCVATGMSYDSGTHWLSVKTDTFVSSS